MIRAVAIAVATIVLTVLAFGAGGVSGSAAGRDNSQARVEYSLASEHSLGARSDCPAPASHSRVPCAAVNLCGAGSCVPAMGHSIQQLAGRITQSSLFLLPDELRLAEWKLEPPMEPPRLFG